MTKNAESFLLPDTPDIAIAGPPSLICFEQPHHIAIELRIGPIVIATAELGDHDYRHQYLLQSMYDDRLFRYTGGSRYLYRNQHGFQRWTKLGLRWQPTGHGRNLIRRWQRTQRRQRGPRSTTAQLLDSLTENR